MKALDGLGLAAVAALTATGVVMMSPSKVAARTPDLHYSLNPLTVADYGETFLPAGLAALEQGLAAYFGPHATPQLPEDAYEQLGIDREQLARGRDLYVARCLHCHGMSGGGDGPTAPFLIPPPRDFRAGKIKFTSTERSAPPTRDDILRVLQRGVAYTAMPSFASDDPADLEALASYVQFLMIRGEAEGLAAVELDDEGTFEEGLPPAELQQAVAEFIDGACETVRDKWAGAADQVILPPTPRPAPDAASLARGRELFLSARTECSACHAADGRGQGPNVYGELKDEAGNVTGVGYKLKDDWGNEARPADLTRGFYRGGDRPIDLYRRIHQGIKGTPMPAFGGSLTPEQIWDLVNYIYSIRYQNAQ